MKMRPHPAAHSHNLSLDHTDSFFDYFLVMVWFDHIDYSKNKNKKITLVYVSWLEE